MSIYTPKTLDQAKDIATLISDNPRDCLRLHAAFGAHFNNDMAITQNNAYMLKGKPSLNADAMAGVVRRSGLCGYMVITSWDNEHCTYECTRTDEPEGIKHVFTYTMQMANAQGLTRNRNWQQMPMQMLRARCLTLMLRATYPDAVSGIYSPDELADNMDISDDERTQISADSLGEEVRPVSRPPQQRPAPRQPSRPPMPQQPPQHWEGASKASAPNEHNAIESIPPKPFQGAPANKAPTPLSVAKRILEAAITDEPNADGVVEPFAWEDMLDQSECIERVERVSNWLDVQTYITGLWVKMHRKPGNHNEHTLSQVRALVSELGYESHLRA
jgi:hypothetical protein